jgi:hypothetical protein
LISSGRTNEFKRITNRFRTIKISWSKTRRGAEG